MGAVVEQTTGKAQAASRKSGKGSLGLVIVPVPGGLYRVSNRDGGTPPDGLGALYTELAWLEEQVAAYNDRKKK